MDLKDAKATLDNLAFQRENNAVVSLSLEDTKAIRAVLDATNQNATFYTFKDSGKWKYEGRGYLSDEVFSSCFTGPARREQILKDNGGKCPGMSAAGRDLIMVVIPDESHDTGFPLLLHPEIRA